MAAAKEDMPAGTASEGKEDLAAAEEKPTDFDQEEAQEKPDQPQAPPSKGVQPTVQAGGCVIPPGMKKVKVILLGDSAVGKSKLVERFTMGGYNPTEVSTFALTTFQMIHKVDDKEWAVEFWDTAGQDRFQTMHPAYYKDANACILVFDVTRKATYQHLDDWFAELQSFRGKIPCILAANKIDKNYKVTKKSYNFAKKNNLPFFFVSAADGTNVVTVFSQAIEEAVHQRIREEQGHFDEEGSDMQYFAEVADTLRYFDEKETAR